MLTRRFADSQKVGSLECLLGTLDCKLIDQGMFHLHDERNEAWNQALPRLETRQFDILHQWGRLLEDITHDVYSCVQCAIPCPRSHVVCAAASNTA